MPPRNKFPGQPEDALPIEGLPPVVDEAPKEQINLRTQRAFGSVPRLLDLQPKPDVEVGVEDVHHITSRYIHANLYGSSEVRTVDKVALNPSEYGKIAIHVPTLLERAVAPVSKKYSLANDVLKTEKELTRRQEVLKDLAPKHVSILEGLRQEIDNLGTLISYAKFPGRRRATEANFRVMATRAWKESFTNVLQVVGDRAHWTPAQRNGAQEALLRSLTTGPQSARIAEWKRFLILSYDYARRREYIFSERANLIESLGTKATADLTAHLDQYGFVPR